MKINLKINMPEQTIQKWINVSYGFGFKRVNPSKKWSEKEKKEAIKYVVNFIEGKVIPDLS